MIYEEAKKARDVIEAQVAEYTARLNSFPKGPMNLTPDHVRATDGWKEAKLYFDNAFQRLREFNGVFVKAYRKEIAAERRAKYPVRTAGAAEAH